MRIDRPAIKIASVGANQKVLHEDEIAEVTITSEKIQWLREFASDFQGVETALVRALEIAALDRAMNQPFVDAFSDALKAFRGQVHDPKNLYRSFEYWSQHEGCEDKADGFLRRYVETDLPFNEQLAEPLRNAMISSIWLKKAVFQSEQRSAARSPFSFMFRDERNRGPTDKTIGENFQKAIKAYPVNEAAHKAYVDWIQQSDDEGLTKKQREQATKRLTEAMERWAKAIPNASQPRLYLAEALLDAGQFEDAAPHIEWINNSRPKDPRLKILPWKSKLFEAMNLCRRKANLPKVPGVLAEVKSLWPDWLSPKWLPYFTAAWLLRSGDQAGFQRQREAIYASAAVEPESLADACMMLGAAQTMKVPAADLKPLRQPIDLAVKNLKQLRTEDLLAAGGFFWEMYQARVFYPAFRMHGSKFGRELLKRFKGDLGLLEKYIGETEFKQSLFWFSECRFWGDGYESKMPPTFRTLVATNHCMAAAYLNGEIKVRYGARNGQLVETAEVLRAAIRRESDPFYRFWFAEIAEAAEEKYRQFEADYGMGGRNMFGGYAEEDDGQCECAGCRAKRASKNTQGSSEPEEINQDSHELLF